MVVYFKRDVFGRRGTLKVDFCKGGVSKRGLVISASEVPHRGQKYCKGNALKVVLSQRSRLL